MGTARELLGSLFGHTSFREHQEGVVRAVLGGRDAFVVMPTSGGKSLCYQLPACVLPGTCLVVSPLISLMKDQVDAARARGIRAAYLNSSQLEKEKRQVLGQLARGQLDLLYVAPERFPLPGFIEAVKSISLCLIAIDEAHCISEWGHDFRPDYLELPNVIRKLPRTPVAAFTATATYRVQADIIKRLRLRRPHQVRASFNRPNLFYEVRPKTNADHQILQHVRVRRGQSGIIYRTTRKKVEETAEWLGFNGIKARPYHAGLEAEVRKDNQDAFDQNKIDVIVATIAFGMGIDKPNIRYIIHGELPKNIESYYQETGRAGRDGHTAHCMLLFDRRDLSTLRYFISQIEDEHERCIAYSKLNEMVDFAADDVCRRRRILAYFGERYPQANCGMCDVCVGSRRRSLSIRSGTGVRRLDAALKHARTKS